MDEQLLAKLQKYLSQNPDSIKFITTFCDYCHDIDDIIDGDKPGYEHILQTFAKAATVYSCNFYHNYYISLYPIVLAITNAYADSLRWEKSAEVWKKSVSDTLRSCGNDMITTVVNIVAGYEAMRDVSITLREVSYSKHHDETGKPI